jgi:hypothetical protein
MEISAKVNESDRANFNTGQPIQVLMVDAIPGNCSAAKPRRLPEWLRATCLAETCADLTRRFS